MGVLYPSDGPSSPLDQTAYTQPALFALEYALAELWRSWGIIPDAVMGHSVGEYVAACVAGVFSLEDGLKLIAARGRLMNALPLDGQMAAVAADEHQVAQVIAAYASEVALAAINGPTNTVISGRREAVEEVLAVLEAEGLKATRLKVSHAFHSPLMDPILADFAQVARQVTYSAPKLTMISNVTGQPAGAEPAYPEYWVRHVRQPVRFAAGMATLDRLGHDLLVEIGPKPVLLGMGRQCLAGDRTVWLPSLRPGQSDWTQLLRSLGELYVRGVRVDWVGYDQDYPRHKLGLPTYPFQRQRCWVDKAGDHPKKVGAAGALESNPAIHPLLGRRLDSALREIQFESRLHPDQPAFLRDHQVFEQIVLPATAYLEMALAAGAAVFQSDSVELEQVVIQQPMILQEDEYRPVQVILTPEETDGYGWQVFSRDNRAAATEPTWTLHASGTVRRGAPMARPEQMNPDAVSKQYSTEVSIPEFYQHYAQIGLDYGPSFQAVTKLWRNDGAAFGRVIRPESLAGNLDGYLLHPVLLDACLQLIKAALPESESSTYVPVGLEQVRLWQRAGERLW
ncbi:MAG: polyketide synthase dehydratase domain-containing protein, partial [Deltaproteobacteria bacterium]|nr:polyketide synthase dehydratase domain-containing protein [Deltaproteobacteria bacterium]